MHMDLEVTETRSKSVSLLDKHSCFLVFLYQIDHLTISLNLLICSQDDESDDEKPPSYGATLEAALAERDQKKGSSKPRVVFVNPAFSTTDL